MGDVPVAEGAHRPLRVPLSLADYVHGADGLGLIGAPTIHGAPTGESAADQLIRLSAASPVGGIVRVARGALRDHEAISPKETRFRE